MNRGEERIEDGVTVYYDHDGEFRRNGSHPDKHLPLMAPTFEKLLADNGVPLLSDTEIRDIARTGRLDGNKLFGFQFGDNQRSAGSCNGQATRGAQETARVRRGEPPVLLSGPYAYSLMNGGRDNGSALASGLVVCRDKGICRRELVPNWNQIYRSTYNTGAADIDAARFKGFLPYAAQTLQGFWTGLALGYDGICAVHAGNNFNRVNSTAAGVDNGSGNHAVRCDGLLWDDDFGPVGTGINSWGTSYGIGGRMGLHTGHFRQTFPNHQFWILPSTIDDPQDAHKPPQIVFPELTGGDPRKAPTLVGV